jgi:hypothetical protein
VTPAPLLTILTPTFRRPTLLAACLASVGRQTRADLVEHLVIVDHVGRGIAGMYQQIPTYRDAVHGAYVYLLADDDQLVSPTALEALAARLADEAPPALVCYTTKGAATWPSRLTGPPVLGQFDLGCLLTRRDVWQAHCHLYGACYEGDFFFASAVHQATGADWGTWPYLFSRGGVMRGAPE